MTKPIVQSVKFSVPPEELFATFMDSEKHSAATGAQAKIHPSGQFSAWNGQIWGRSLLIEPNRMVVQAWRSVNFMESDPDSILVLEFLKDGAGGRINLVHVNVPRQDHQRASKGWPKYYWKPWKKYFATRARASAK